MIEITVYRDGNRNIVKYTVSGHARYNRVPRVVEYFLRPILARRYAGYPEAGKDVICAAVSSIAQTAVIGLIEVLNLKAGVNVEDGFLECILPEDLDEGDRKKAGIILDTMFLALMNIKEQYGKFIEVIETEV